MSDLDHSSPYEAVGKNHSAMPPIDLTLAVNFIPAVVCLCKAVLMAFCLSMLDPGEHLGGFVIFVMLLNLDRAVSSARIFDENAVQCCILASWIINYLRSLADSPKWVPPVATFLWVLFSSCLVAEPRRVREFFVMYGHGSGGTFRRVLPGVVSSLFVVAMAFTRLEAETWVVKSARSIGFACLCVAWVYVVSVWRPRPRQSGACVFECHLLLSRFCLVLYVHWVVAALYASGCVALLVHHYVQIHVSGGRQTVCAEETGSLMSGHMVAPDHAADEEAIFINNSSCDLHSLHRQETSAQNIGHCGQQSHHMSHVQTGQSHLHVRRQGLLASNFAIDSASLSSAVESMNTIMEEDGDEELEVCFHQACRVQQ